MKLYLIRHGQAVEENVDPKRPLSGVGKEQAQRAADALKAKGAKIDEIWHSTKLRAKQTAEIIAKTLSVKKVIEKKGLNPNDPVQPIADDIKLSEANIAIAGHMPFLSKLASLLRTGSEEAEEVDFGPGEVVEVDVGIGERG